MVELQGQLQILSEAGIKVYGISYDAVSDLKEFSDRYSIDYEVGILNPLIEADSQVMTPAGKTFYGLPYPGVYVLDEQGLVDEKFFNRSYATRDSAGSILNSALGEVLKPESTPEIDFANEQIQFTAFLADPELTLEYNSILYVRFEVAEGLHIYAFPAVLLPPR
ncbi:MAG TPA: redoxin domain-containing protein [Dehalococcoidia bacterium]|nr:redoxin domain-containing protein [Dehalococcoidia bacterium]